MHNKLFAAVFTATILISQFAVAAPSIIVNATPANPIAPATIMLSVSQSADPSPVTITQVEYFYANASLGIALNAPFSLTVPDLPAATYPIVAKATTTDPNNPVLQSTPVQVVVALPAGSAKAYFIHTDQLNTPRTITDSGGNEVWRWDSDPFGKDAPNEQPTGQAKFVCNQRFPGQQYDRETNLHYNYFRDFDPTLGRYIESDPIGLMGGVNTYGYVGSSPLVRVDPNGLQALPMPPPPPPPGVNSPGRIPLGGEPGMPASSASSSWAWITKPSPYLPTWSLPDWASGLLGRTGPSDGSRDNGGARRECLAKCERNFVARVPYCNAMFGPTGVAPNPEKYDQCKKEAIDEAFACNEKCFKDHPCN